MKLIVMGTGKRAQSYVHVARQQSEVSGIGIWSRNTARAKELADQWGVGQALDDNDFRMADAFIVTNAPEDHATTIALARIHRKPMLLEKPITMDAQETSQILRSLNSENIPFAVAFGKRLNRTTRRALDFISSSGTPLEATVTFWSHAGDNPAAVRQWLLLEGIHSLDLLFFLFAPFPAPDAGKAPDVPAAVFHAGAWRWHVSGAWPYPLHVVLYPFARALHRNAMIEIRSGSQRLYVDDLSTGDEPTRPYRVRRLEWFITNLKCRLAWVATSRSILKEFIRMMRGQESPLAQGDLAASQILCEQLGRTLPPLA